MSTHKKNHYKGYFVLYTLEKFFFILVKIENINFVYFIKINLFKF